MTRIAINGFGRIGRNILRALIEGGYEDRFEIVAINDLAPPATSLHLLRFDTTHGRFNADVSIVDEQLMVDKQLIQMFSNRDPLQLPWGDLKVDLVMECTGFFRSREKAALHLEAGAKKVLVSAPGKSLDATVVYGVNHQLLSDSDLLVSNASCTTNCLAHLAKAINDSVGIESGLATTIHSYTNTQNLLDSYHKDMRRARAAAHSMIPTTTGSAKAIGSVIPELEGKLDAVSVRVPTLNVSLLDFTFKSNTPTSTDELIEVFTDYQSKNKGVFEITDQDLVSIDYNHHPASCIVDSKQIRQSGEMFKVMAWYDNEWAFSNRMLDTAAKMANLI